MIFPPDSRQRHFIRRTKEEMVRFDGSPLYPQRNCATLSYDLSQGPQSEQELYDETTEYLQHHYKSRRNVKPIRCPLGDERLPAAARQFHLRPHALL